MMGSFGSSVASRRVVTYLLLFGLFLTFRGYRSREVDQAYRLPILLHGQDARLYAADPFVRSFDGFNPHRGYLALIDGVSRPLGLSLALATLFGLTFLVTVAAVDRLAFAVGGDQRPGAGVVAAGLFLIALAGNVGTNHLFEPMLMDRQVAFALGWGALALVVVDPEAWVRVSSLLVGAAALIHPSVGIQLAMLLSVSWLAWRFAGRGAGVLRTADAVKAVLVLGAALVPGVLLNLRNSGLILRGLSPAEVGLLAAELQSPQHMLPHLWRTPQWLAWACYPALAFASWLSLRSDPGGPGDEGKGARSRLVIVLCITLAGLALAWFGVEQLHSLRLTLFQPFRMATVARGLCLVLVAGRVRDHWASGRVTGRLRSVLIGVGLLGDWTMVAATAFELTMTAADLAVAAGLPGARRVGVASAFVVLAGGLIFLSRHDTESGHVPLLAAAVTALGLGRVLPDPPRPLTPRRLAFRLGAAWVVPLAALAANVAAAGGSPAPGSLQDALVRRCRFAEIAVDPVERLGLWCRENTPVGARFVGPPGPKTFRLWSRRSLAFNRAGSPYDAEGLADWAERFRDHVAFAGTNAEFVRAYARDRHALERRYDGLSDSAMARLAVRQGAGYVLAPARRSAAGEGPLTLLRAEGKYAVYRVDLPVHLAGRRPESGGAGRRP